MKSLVCFGEALIDLLQDPMQPNVYHSNAGGAPANVAVGFAKLGGSALFIGTLGMDRFADLLYSEFVRYGVRTQAIVRTDKAFTAIAVVSLAANGERSFGFYRDYSADLLFSAADFRMIDFISAPYFHFCSNTLTHPSNRAATHAGVALAAAHACMVSFDVNIRTSLWPKVEEIKKEIASLLTQAHIIKCSAEEWQFLCEGSSEWALLQRCFAGQTQLILITDGAAPLRAIEINSDQYIAVSPVDVVDSTAAGDAFMAGLLFYFARSDVTVSRLANALADKQWLQQALLFAARCGGYTCGHYGAFMALPVWLDVAQ
jgi:fructokinase